MAFEWLADVKHSVWEHPYAHIYEIPKCYEINLPLSPNVSAQLVSTFGENHRNFISESKRGISEKIVDYCKELPGNIENAVEKLVLMFEPYSLVLTNQTWYVRAVSKSTEDKSSDHMFFHLPSLARISRLVSEIQPIACVGIRENYPGDGGYFPIEHEIEDGLTPEIKHWSDSAIPFYIASNGEVVVSDRDGQVGWYRIERGYVSNCNFTLLEFFAAFIEHKLNDGWQYDRSGKLVYWPLDSYSFARRDLIQPLRKESRER